MMRRTAMRTECRRIAQRRCLSRVLLEAAADEEGPARRLRLDREAERLVEAKRRFVLLVDDELDAPDAAGARRLEGALDELAPVAAAARCLSHEQVLEPAVLGAGPDAEAVAQLARADRFAGVVEGKQELGVLGVQELRGYLAD